ncbi:hypothetical protein M378DRAFT_166852 [Amanita muscaria Koide BX008]|uniref:Uncharacterized protein n=1 Tax=Amanita muscaria (strain Koide BX008) TaxID=946122 RepID=A0A0C2T4U6_AMAMK|nr:hypothetical protein M378DRAFT_166852 [Amanita muscaria Koide BX008]
MTRPIKLKSSYQAIGDQSKYRILPIPPHPNHQINPTREQVSFSCNRCINTFLRAYKSMIQCPSPPSVLDNYQGDYIGNHRSTHRTISIQQPSRSSRTRTLHLMLQPPCYSVEKKLFHHLKTLRNTVFASPNNVSLQRTTISQRHREQQTPARKIRNRPQPPLTPTSPALPFAPKSFPHA